MTRMPVEECSTHQEASLPSENIDNAVRLENSARSALLSRPKFSLRLQIFLGFSLAFLFAVLIAVALFVTTNQTQKKLRFLEIVNDYVIEIDQARRFEKNYFLYGTNLGDALENVYQARDILERHPQELQMVLEKGERDKFLEIVNQYERLLKRLVELSHLDSQEKDYERDKKSIELDLRKHGQKMVSDAQDLMDKERTSLMNALLRTKTLQIYSLIFLLIFLILYGYYLGGRVLGGIDRFAAHAQRIASGDFSPIMPTKPYRDEFTDLAIAINKMLDELGKRETLTIQSHKIRAVGTLTAGVAHELNNPLNNITLTAAMFLEDYQRLSDEERLEMVQDVLNEASRSKRIISNLLDFARESSSQLEIIDLVQVIKETIDLARNQIRLSDIKIEFDPADNLPRIHGDSQQLKQVFLNLIFNAADASPKGGKIRILTLPADDPGYVAVKVLDFGAGIPEQTLSSIFDPFFTTKAKSKGSGLGLSVSQGIVAKHGGKITVSSKEGAGSTFTVILPVTTILAEVSAQG